jgi:hypothetical protein
MAPTESADDKFTQAEEATPTLQAILLADSFTQKFRPITLD